MRRFVGIKPAAPTAIIPVYFGAMLLIAVFFVGAAYAYHQRFDIPFAQVVEHRRFFTADGLLPTIGLFLLAPLIMTFMSYVGWRLWRHLSWRRTRKIFFSTPAPARRQFSRKFFAVATPVVAVGAGVVFAHYVGAIDYFLMQMQPATNFYEEHYIDPRDVKISFPAHKRNLLVISVESLDAGFLTKADGGAFDDDLLPNIKKLAAENLNFSQSEKIGGAAQYYGTGWTIAGLLAYFAGVPDTHSWVDLDPNNEIAKTLAQKFMPGAVALGDILAANGYRNYYLSGQDASFAGMDSFFRTHGNTEIFDYPYFKRAGELPADYKVEWGFTDHKLYQFAQEKLTKIAAQAEPFFFTLTTLDTHPLGYLDPQAERKFPVFIENVYADADKQLGEFVAWLQQQDFYADTTVVIWGDHLCNDHRIFPDSFAGKDVHSGYKRMQRIGNGARRPLNIFINSPLSPKFAKNRQFSHFDIFPTLVEAVGGKIAAPGLGLGRSMSSGEKTLLEELGYDAVNDQLKRPSRRYDELWINNSGGE
ncbi:hypothetical protein FACS1894107_15400 [Planctomycetales bacterium]|nr:hypothetical protein FACS1894107_15400 [Planctomycetales bacterium]GHT00941.1 hypothetical protein FACS1894108_14070 [Planctomycetales bacterium]